MAHFLVVDDDHATVNALTSLLKGDGHEVSAFTSGTEAVDALSHHAFDAVITDLEMPQTDRHAVIGAARERSPLACLIVATAKATERDHRLLADAGACIILDKPFDYEATTRAITDCRMRRGPGAFGGCHKNPDPSHIVQLRRR